MTTHTISSDNGQHIVKIIDTGSTFSSRLYINSGETATTISAKATTLTGAKKQANRMLSDAA